MHVCEVNCPRVTIITLPARDNSIWVEHSTSETSERQPTVALDYMVRDREMRIIVA
jgi:hypothetical protein